MTTTRDQIQQVRGMIDRMRDHFGTRKILKQVCSAVEFAVVDGDVRGMERAWSRLEQRLHGVPDSYVRSRDSSLSDSERAYWLRINIAEHAAHQAARSLVRGVTSETQQARRRAPGSPPQPRGGYSWNRTEERW